MKTLLSILLAAALLACPSAPAYAAPDDSFPFAVEVIPDENQIGSTAYYHVPGQPGQRIEFKARLSNLLGEQLEIRVVAMNAYSSKDGIIYQTAAEAQTQGYALAGEEYGLSRYMEFYDQIILAPNEVKEVVFSVTVPDIDTGVLLGSIRFVVFAGTGEMKADNTSDVQILIDKYQAIDTAVQIDLPGSTESCIIIQNTGFNTEKMSVDFDIVNKAAKIEDEVSGAYDILDANGTVLFSGDIAGFKMAPSTRLRYSAPWRHETLEEGQYMLSASLDYDNKREQFEQPFIIGNSQVAEAAEIQAEKEEYETEPVPQIKVQADYTRWIVLGCSLALIICLLVFGGTQKRGARA